MRRRRNRREFLDAPPDPYDWDGEWDTVTPMPRSGGMAFGFSGPSSRRCRPGSAAEDLPLDYLPKERLDVRAFATLETVLEGKPSAYVRLLLGEFNMEDVLKCRPPRIRKISRQLSRQAGYLLSQGIIEEHAEHEIHTMMALFAVLKKNGKGRLIANAKAVNRYFREPFKMELPSLHSYIDYIMQAEVAAVADARCFFYQIPLPEKLKPFFGVRFPKGKRGGLAHYVFNVIPMGWKWSPALAPPLQRGRNGVGGQLCHRRNEGVVRRSKADVSTTSPRHEDGPRL